MRVDRDFAIALYNTVSSAGGFSSAQEKRLITMARGLNYDAPAISWGIITFYDPKQWAVAKGSYDKLKLVLDCEDATHPNSRGRSAYSGDAFRMAVNKRYWDLATLLIERRGGAIREQCEDAADLYEQCYVGALDMGPYKYRNVLRIFEHGSDLIEGNARDQINRLLQATDISAFLKRDSRLFNFVKDNGALLTSVEYFASQKVYSSSLREFIDKINLRMLGNEKFTEEDRLKFIKIGIKGKSWDFVRFLLKTREEIPAKYAEDYNQLLFAFVKEKQGDLIRNLLGMGANQFTKKNGRTPCELAFQASFSRAMVNIFLDNLEEIPPEDADAYGKLLFALVKNSKFPNMGRDYNIARLIKSGPSLLVEDSGRILLEFCFYKQIQRYLGDIIEAIGKILTQENVGRFQQALNFLISRKQKSIYLQVLKLIEVLGAQDPCLDEKKTLISNYNAHPDASSYYQFVMKYLPEFQDDTKFITSILLKSLKQKPSILFASSNEGLQVFYNFSKQFFQTNETELTPRLRELMLSLAAQQKDDAFLNSLLKPGVNSAANYPTHPILAALEGDNHNALEVLKAHGFNLFELLRPNMSQHDMYRLGEALEKIFKENSENSVSYLTFFVNELLEHPELVERTVEDAIFFYNMILYDAYENNLEAHVSRIIDSDNIYIKGMLSHALLYAITRNESLTKDLLQRNIDFNNEEETIKVLIETGSFGSYFAVINKVANGGRALSLLPALVFQLMDSIKVSEQEDTLKVDKFEYLVAAGYVNWTTRNHKNQTILDKLIEQKKWDLLYRFISHRDYFTQDESAKLTRYLGKMLRSSSGEINKARFKFLLQHDFITPETKMEARIQNKGLIGISFQSILEILFEQKEWQLLIDLVSAYPAHQNPNLARQYGKFLFELVETESDVDYWMEDPGPDDLLELFLQSGADKTVKNSQGQTPVEFMTSQLEGCNSSYERTSLSVGKYASKISIFSGYPTDAEDKAGYLIGCRQLEKNINENGGTKVNSSLLRQAMMLAKAASTLETEEWKQQRAKLALGAILLHQPEHLEFFVETDVSCRFKDIFSNQNDIDSFINHILENKNLEHLESYLNLLIRPLIKNVGTAKSVEAIQFYKTLLISFYQKGLCRERILLCASTIVDDHQPLHRAILMAAIKEEDTLGLLNYLLGLNPELSLSKEEFIETLLEAKTLNCFKLVVAHLKISASNLAATLLPELQNNLIPNCSEEGKNPESIQSNKLNFLLSQEHVHTEKVATILDKMREHKLWKSILILVKKFPATENPTLATIYGELLFDYLREKNVSGVSLLLAQGADVTVTETHKKRVPQSYGYLETRRRYLISPTFKIEETTETAIELAARCEGWRPILNLFSAIQLDEGDTAAAELFGTVCLKLLKGSSEDQELLTCILHFTINCMAFNTECWRDIRGKVLYQVIELDRDDDLEALLRLNINPNTSVTVAGKKRSLFQLALLLNKPNSLKLLLEYAAELKLDWLKACETPDFWEKQGCDDGLSRMDCLMEFVSYVNTNSEHLDKKVINFVKRLGLFSSTSDGNSVSTYCTVPEFGIFAPVPRGRGGAANSSDGTENSDAESELSVLSGAAST